MKKCFLLSLLICFCTVLSAQNKLISYKLWKTVPREELQKKMKDEHVPQSLLKVRYSVDIYDVLYWTTWHDGSSVCASGLYFVPQGVKTPMAQVDFHHGTRIIPGRQAELTGEDYLCVGLAVDGYTVLMPDYLGLGNGERFHLWQHAATEGQASVDMLFAIRELNDTLGIKLNGQLFISGYSQGGHATLATTKLIQEKYSNDFKITASSAMSGAYDLTGAQAKIIYQPYPQPHYLPYLLHTYNEIYKMLPYDINRVYKSPYDTIIPKMFDGTHNVDEINKALPSIPSQMLVDSILNVYKTDPTFPLHKALRENSLIDWKPQMPVQLCYCNSDEEVMYQNSIAAYKTMRANGAKHITLRNGGKKYGHFKCAIFSSMYTKLYFDSFRNGSKYGRKGNVWKRFLLSLARAAIKP